MSQNGIKALFAFVLWIVAGWASSARADGDAAAKTPTPTTMEKSLGTSVASDYTAKHFSLLFGAIVLNPFKVSHCAKNDCSKDGTAADMDPSRLRLDSGTTDAHPFLEAGFRYRWAWLDRLAYRVAAERRARKDSPDLALALAALEAAQRDVDAAEANKRFADLDSKRAAASDPKTGAAAHDAQMEADKRVDEAKDKLAAAKERMQALGSDAAGRDDQTYDKPDMFFGPWAIIEEEKWAFLVPDDWDLRMGFAFSSSSSTVSSIAGGSDFYSELAGGWNLVRWSMPTGSEKEAPIRGAIDAELCVSFSTDSAINDIHERYLVGGSAVFGIPIPSNPDEAGKPNAEPRPDPIAELVARLGAVDVELPTFINDATSEVAIKNQVADFRSKRGLGADVELNVPVPGNLGYLVARGSLDAGFDPNPWTLQLGYTIPISRLAGAFKSN